MADQQSGSSTSAFVSSLIFNLIIFAIFISIFIFLRNKYTNVYRPRTLNKTLPDHLKAPPLSDSTFGWLPDLMTRPTKFVIEQTGIDGYFFLRYLLLWANVGFFCGLILWPILFAINATGGGGQSGFNIISYANNTHKWRVFANLFLSWFFFGFVVYTIYVELVYYTGFRHNLQCTQFYSSLPSSKVLLIDNVEEGLLFEDSLRKLFPAAQKIVISRDTKEAQEIWKKRNKLINKLEGAFTKVINKCLKKRSKIEKQIEKGKEGYELPTTEGQITSYMDEKKLPSYKYKPIIGKSKKVFNEGIDEMNEFNTKLNVEQTKIKESPETLDKLGSVFLEFSSHLELQRAYQAVGYSEHFKTSRRYQSFLPEEVIWKNVDIGFVARKSKRSGAITFLTLMIIFWAIPVAVVGCISNINYLTEKVHFLRFIDNMPSVLMGIITGILPSVLLSILMSLVPPIIRWMGKIGGILTLQQLDFWTQQWFFGFQVIQVFLVTTCTSAASSVVTSIINNPSSALEMLSNNLPPASNFYISYMLLQGLSISSGILAQIVGLILSFIIGRLFDKTPRQKWNRDVSLGSPSWGTLYGTFGLFTVIMLCYAIIAPIIIAFTSIAFLLIYIAQYYSFVYVSGHTTDNRGRNYPLALFEVFVGVYLGEISLIALFVMQKNWACVVLEAVWLGLTVLAHLYFRYLFEPVLDTVPIGAIEGNYPSEDFGKMQIKNVGEDYFVSDESGGDFKQHQSSSDSLTGTNKSDYKSDSFNGTLEKKATLSTRYDSNNGNLNSNANENYQSPNAGLDNKLEHFPAFDQVEEDFQKKQNLKNHGYSNMASNFGSYIGGDYKKGFRYAMTWFFRPKEFLQYSDYRPYMPDFWTMPISKSLTKDVVYQPPEINEEKEPILWIAEDKLGLSKQVVQLCNEHGVKCADTDAKYNEKAKVTVTEESYPPGYESTIMY